MLSRDENKGDWVKVSLKPEQVGLSALPTVADSILFALPYVVYGQLNEARQRAILSQRTAAPSDRVGMLGDAII